MEVDVATTNVDELPECLDTTDKFYALINSSDKLDYQSILQLKYYENQDWNFVIKYLNSESEIYFCNICEYQINGKPEVLEHIKEDKHKLHLKLTQNLSHPQIENTRPHTKDVSGLYENEMIEISNDSADFHECQIQDDAKMKENIEYQQNDEMISFSEDDEQYFNQMNELTENESVQEGAVQHECLAEVENSEEVEEINEENKIANISPDEENKLVNNSTDDLKNEELISAIEITKDVEEEIDDDIQINNSDIVERSQDSKDSVNLYTNQEHENNEIKSKVQDTEESPVIRISDNGELKNEDTAELMNKKYITTNESSKDNEDSDATEENKTVSSEIEDTEGKLVIDISDDCEIKIDTRSQQDNNINSDKNLRDNDDDKKEMDEVTDTPKENKVVDISHSNEEIEGEMQVREEYLVIDISDNAEVNNKNSAELANKELISSKQNSEALTDVAEITDVIIIPLTNQTETEDENKIVDISQDCEEAENTDKSPELENKEIEGEMQGNEEKEVIVITDENVDVISEADIPKNSKVLKDVAEITEVIIIPLENQTETEDENKTVDISQDCEESENTDKSPELENEEIEGEMPGNEVIDITDDFEIKIGSVIENVDVNTKADIPNESETDISKNINENKESANAEENEVIDISDDCETKNDHVTQSINKDVNDDDNQKVDEVIDIPDDCEETVTVAKKHNSNCQILNIEVLNNYSDEENLLEKSLFYTDIQGTVCDNEIMDIDGSDNESSNKTATTIPSKEKNPLDIQVDSEVIDLDLDDEETEIQPPESPNEVEMNDLANEETHPANTRKRRSDISLNGSSIIEVIEKHDVIEILSSDEENNDVEPAKKSKPNSPTLPLAQRSYHQNSIITSTNKRQEDYSFPPTLSIANRQFSTSVEYKNLGLIGVEYVVKLLCEENDLLPKYICYLCDRIQYSAKNMQDHLMDIEHRLHYCQLHFPTAVRHLNEFVESFSENRRNEVNQYMLQKLTEAIENHHGHSEPFTYMKEEFRKNIINIRENLMLIRHASEKNGPTFTDVFDASNIDEIVEKAQIPATNMITEILFEKKKENSYEGQMQRAKFNRPNRFINNRRYIEQNSQKRHHHQNPFYIKRQQYRRNQFRSQQQQQQQYDNKNINTNTASAQVLQPLKSILKRSTTVPDESVSTTTPTVDNTNQNQNYFVARNIVLEPPAMPIISTNKPLKSILKNPIKKESQTTINEKLDLLPIPPPALLNTNPKARAIHESVVSINKLIEQTKNNTGTNPNNSTVQHNQSDDILKLIKKSLQNFYVKQSTPTQQNNQIQQTNLSRALQNYKVPTNLPVKDANISLLAETAKKFQSNSPTCEIIDDINLISVLRRLIALDNYVGSLIDQLTTLFYKALNLKSLSSKEIHNRLLTDDNRKFLQLVSEKFKGVLICQLASDEQAKRAIKTAIEQIEQLLAL